MSFFIHIKLVVHVLVCAYAIRHIKWRRLNFLTLYNMLYHVHGSCSCCDKFGVLNSKNIHLIYIKVIFGKKFATFLLPGSMYVINLLSCKPLLWKWFFFSFQNLVYSKNPFWEVRFLKVLRTLRKMTNKLLKFLFELFPSCQFALN